MDHLRRGTRQHFAQYRSRIANVGCIRDGARLSEGNKRISRLPHEPPQPGCGNLYMDFPVATTQVDGYPRMSVLIIDKTENSIRGE